VAGAVISPNSLAGSTDLGYRSTRSAAGVIALVALFYALTMRAGLPWGDDYALYYAHARNLVTGQPYANTGYIFNPFQPEVGPSAYPPFFPVILAPVVAAVGWNPSLIKIPGVLLFLAALWCIFTCLRRRIPGLYAVAVVAFVGFNPYLWLLKDVPVSDTAFLFLLFFTFHCISAAERRGWLWKHSAAVGALLYLCFACRAAGIILPPVLLTWQVLKRRRLPRHGVWLSVLAAFTGMLLQVVWLRGETSYADQVHPNLRMMAHDVVRYGWSVRKLLLSLSSWDGWIVVCILLILGLSGYVLAVRRDFTVMEIFAPSYLALVMLWTSDQDVRFLLPLLPLLWLYVCMALVRLTEVGRRRLAGSLAAALAGTFLLSYVVFFARAPYGPIQDGPNDKGFLSVCQFIVHQTAPDTTILFRRPRLLALLTGRKSAVYPIRAKDQIVTYGRRIGAAYVVAGQSFEDDRKTLIPVIIAHPDMFEVVFRSGRFAVYRLRPAR
jgi:4-amino-4-deoxy-L-arabinose transferase-like glycosyltransferase